MASEDACRPFPGTNHSTIFFDRLDEVVAAGGFVPAVVSEEGTDT